MFYHLNFLSFNLKLLIFFLSFINILFAFPLVGSAISVNEYNDAKVQSYDSIINDFLDQLQNLNSVLSRIKEDQRGSMSTVATILHGMSKNVDERLYQVTKSQIDQQATLQHILRSNQVIVEFLKSVPVNTIKEKLDYIFLAIRKAMEEHKSLMSGLQNVNIKLFNEVSHFGERFAKNEENFSKLYMVIKDIHEFSLEQTVTSSDILEILRNHEFDMLHIFHMINSTKNEMTGALSKLNNTDFEIFLRKFDSINKVNKDYLYLIYCTLKDISLWPNKFVNFIKSLKHKHKLRKRRDVLGIGEFLNNIFKSINDGYTEFVDIIARLPHETIHAVKRSLPSISDFLKIFSKELLSFLTTAFAYYINIMSEIITALYSSFIDLILALLFVLPFLISARVEFYSSLYAIIALVLFCKIIKFII
nr:MAG: hypothetical protein [Drosophila Hillwood park negevirus]